MKAKPYKAEEAELQKVEEPAVAYSSQEIEGVIEDPQNHLSFIADEEAASIVMKNRKKLRETIEISRKQKEAGLGIDQEEFRNRPSKWRKGD